MLFEDEADPTTKNTTHKKKDEGENYLFIVLFYFLGTACFVPHSFYVTANKYWMYKFRDPYQPFNETDTAEKTTLQKNFTAYAGVTGNVGMTVFFLLTIMLRGKIELQNRIIGGIVFLLFLFVVTIVFVFVNTDSVQEEFFVIALLIGALLHAGAAVLIVSVFELALKFNPRCLAAQMAGQSLCGIFSAAVQIISLMALNSVKGTAGLFYFVAVAVLGGILITYMIMLFKSDEFQEHLRKEHEDKEAVEPPKFTLDRIKKVFKELYMFIISLVLSTSFTLIVQPGLTVLAESSEKGQTAWGDTYFLPVSVFFLYNTFEFIGRELSNYTKKLINPKIILIAALIRMVLFPLILLCNLQPRHHLPVVFNNDAFFMIFLIILAISGGYILNLVIIQHSEYVEPEEKVISSATITIIIILLSPIVTLLSGVFVQVI